MLDATPLLRLYARRRLARLSALDPVAAQETELKKLLHRAKDTRFGRDHGFGSIRTVAEFQERVSLRRYEDFWTAYWKDAFPRLKDVSWPGTIPYFAVTSGTTTGVTKYIPCSTEMVRANKRAASDLLAFHAANRPRSRILAGRNLMLGGSTDLKEQAPGIYSGDLSGIAAANVPLWARPRFYPPREVALLADWEEKVARMARGSLGANIRSISGTPSWLLLFFDKVAEIAGSASHCLADLYPDLEMIGHGGVHFGPYRARFDALMAGGHAETREAYAASEGFVAAADRGSGEGLRMMLDNGLFFEFVPVDELASDRPTRHWIANAELEVNYAVALSSCAGCWSYIIGDTVKLVGRDPPRVLVTGRTSYSLSAFGEHLIDAEIEEAVTAAAAKVGATVVDYSVGPVFSAARGERGRHQYIVEFAEPVSEPARIEDFAAALDAALTATNEDYAAHRAGGFGLDAPCVVVLRPGAFAAWMKERGRLGGQNKVPRIINDETLLADLRSFAETHRAV
jgi:GH3 auxin-responsive promoter